MIYKLNSGGVTITAKSKTLTGAKREASAWMSYGAGVSVSDEDGRVYCWRNFYGDGDWHRFGWSKWIEAH